jgi:membrane protein
MRSRGVDRDVQRVERDLDEARDDAEQELHRHPRFAALLDLLRGVMREQSAEQVGLAASGAAFWLVISALPTAIAVVSLFGLVVDPEKVADELGTFANDAPGSLGSLLTDQLRHVAAGSHAGLSLGLAISLILAVWSASAGVYNLDRAIRVSYGLPSQRYVEARGRALVGAFVVVILLGLSAVIGSLAEARSSTIVEVLGAPVALVAITVAVAALYWFALGHGVAVRALLPGAITSAIGVVLVTFGFGAYVAASTRYTAVYGAFAGVVIAMLAVYFAVYVILLGAVLNMQLGRGVDARAR